MKKPEFECAKCGQKKEVYARVGIEVAERVKTAAICHECFEAAFKNTAVKMMLNQFLPPEWREVLNVG